MFSKASNAIDQLNKWQQKLQPEKYLAMKNRAFP